MLVPSTCFTQLNWLQSHCASLDTSILHDLVDDLRGGLYRLNRSLPGLQGRPDLLRELLEYLVNLAALELVKEDDNLAMLKWLRSSIVFPSLIVSRLDDGTWIVGDKIVPVINLATSAAAKAINGSSHVMVVLSSVAQAPTNPRMKWTRPSRPRLVPSLTQCCAP